MDLASSWLNKSSKFLEKQELWMRIFSLCPFLFGINNIVSAAWMKALFSAKLLLNEKRCVQRELDETSRDKTSHAIFCHFGQNKTCFVRGGKNGMGCFVRGDKNYMGCFVRGGKSMRGVLSRVSKNGMGCFVLGCFVLHSCTELNL